MAQKKNARTTRVRRSERKNIAVGQAHIKSTFNNTIVSISDPQGNVISWQSGGTVGFKGSRKSTPFAAQLAAEAAAKAAMEHGLHKVAVFVKGPGSGRETAIRSLQAAGLEVSGIQDKTPIAHNGCRPKKRRRNPTTVPQMTTAHNTHTVTRADTSGNHTDAGWLLSSCCIRIPSFGICRCAAGTQCCGSGRGCRVRIALIDGASSNIDLFGGVNQ